MRDLGVWGWVRVGMVDARWGMGDRMCRGREEGLGLRFLPEDGWVVNWVLEKWKIWRSKRLLG